MLIEKQQPNTIEQVRAETKRKGRFGCITPGHGGLETTHYEPTGEINCGFENSPIADTNFGIHRVLHYKESNLFFNFGFHVIRCITLYSKLITELGLKVNYIFCHEI